MRTIEFLRRENDDLRRKLADAERAIAALRAELAAVERRCIEPAPLTEWTTDVVPKSPIL